MCHSFLTTADSPWPPGLQSLPSQAISHLAPEAQSSPPNLLTQALPRLPVRFKSELRVASIPDSPGEVKTRSETLGADRKRGVALSFTGDQHGACQSPDAPGACAVYFLLLWLNRLQGDQRDRSPALLIRLPTLSLSHPPSVTHYLVLLNHTAVLLQPAQSRPLLYQVWLLLHVGWQVSGGEAALMLSKGAKAWVCCVAVTRGH